MHLTKLSKRVSVLIKKVPKSLRLLSCWSLRSILKSHLQIYLLFFQLKMIQTKLPNDTRHLQSNFILKFAPKSHFKESEGQTFFMSFSSHLSHKNSYKSLAFQRSRCFFSHLSACWYDFYINMFFGVNLKRSNCEVN